MCISNFSAPLNSCTRKARLRVRVFYLCLRGAVSPTMSKASTQQRAMHSPSIEKKPLVALGFGCGIDIRAL